MDLKHKKSQPSFTRPSTWLRKFLNFALIGSLITGFSGSSTSKISIPSQVNLSSTALLERSLASDPDVHTVQGLTEVLKKVFESYPSARNLSDSTRLAQAAAKLFSPAVAAEIKRIHEVDKARYNEARNSALQATPVRSNGKTFAVSGLSSSGLVAAMVAANAGYEVVGYEARGEYTRNIQWTARQCIIDTFALINQNLSDDFLKRIIRPVPLETDLVNNEPKDIIQLKPALRGDPARVPDSPGDMLNQDTVTILRTKETEKFLLSYLEKLSNVKVQIAQTPSLAPNGDQGYSIDGVGTPDLIVVAEGSGSKTRKALGIDHAPTSPARLQIAGELVAERNGALSFNEEHVTYENGQSDILLTSAISKKDSSANWTVTDVPKNVNLEPAGLTPGTPEYKAKKQELVDKYYVNALARVLQKSEAEVRRMKVNGPIENFPPTSFLLQQNISKTAVYGNNVIAIGDTVGNAHWNVGGGAHIAMVSHIRRLSNLIFDLEMGRERGAALREYDKMVKSDSLEWGRRGIVDFYPEHDPELVKKRFDESVRWWMEQSHPTKSPYEYLAARIANDPKRPNGTHGNKDAHGGNLCRGLFR